jgi:hypothetical protein
VIGVAAHQSAASQAAPGVLGFLVVAGMGVILYFVFRSMARHLRKISVTTVPAGAAPVGTGPARAGLVSTGAAASDQQANAPAVDGPVITGTVITGTGISGAGNGTADSSGGAEDDGSGPSL